MDTRKPPTRFGTVVRQIVQRIDRIWRNALDKRRAAQRSVRAWHAMRLLNDATLRDIGLQRSDLTRLLLVDKTAAPKRQRPQGDGNHGAPGHAKHMSTARRIEWQQVRTVA